MAEKMNLRITTKSHAADSEIGFLAKSISKSNGCATAMPTAWELGLARNFDLIPEQERELAGISDLVTSIN